MQSHREMFQNEVQLEEAKYLQLQNEKQAAQSELQGKHLEQILQQVKELRDSNTQMESLLSKQLDTITHAVWTEHDDNKFSTAENENTEREILCLNSYMSRKSGLLTVNRRQNDGHQSMG